MIHFSSLHSIIAFAFTIFYRYLDSTFSFLLNFAMAFKIRFVISGCHPIERELFFRNLLISRSVVFNKLIQLYNNIIVMFIILITSIIQLQNGD